MSVVLTVSTSGTFTTSNSVTVSDADATRLLNAMKTAKGMAGATNAQVWQAVVNDFFTFLRVRTRSVENAAAEAAGTDITMS